MLRIWYCNFPLLKLNDQVKTVLLLYVYSNYTKHNNGLDWDVALLVCKCSNAAPVSMVSNYPGGHQPVMTAQTQLTSDITSGEICRVEATQATMSNQNIDRGRQQGNE